MAEATEYWRRCGMPLEMNPDRDLLACETYPYGGPAPGYP
jgi:hypothetical protein